MDKRQYADLLEKIATADRYYFVDNNPIISDEEYDLLVKQVVEIEKVHPEWKKEDSPTVRIGYPTNSYGTEVNHTSRMYSLDKAHDIDKVLLFIKKVTKAAEGDTTICLSDKLDGLALDIWYRDYTLNKIITRGDGITGIDITHLYAHFGNLPLHLPKHKSMFKDIDFRGECLFKKAVYEDYVQPKTDSRYSNSRNAVSGIMMSKEVNPLFVGKVDFVCYDFNLVDIEEVSSVIKWNIAVKDILTAVYHRVYDTRDIDGILDAILNWKGTTNSPYDTDGIVLRVDDYYLHKKMGYTDRAPRAMIAYKFPPKGAYTTLEDIEYQVTRTGKLVPVAKLTPVNVDGVVISSCSMFNSKSVVEMEPHYNDTVYISRQGDVIPVIGHIKYDKRAKYSEPILLPKECPTCNTPLHFDPTLSPFQYCTNVNCKGILLEGLAHFTSKSGIDAKGISKGVWSKFVELGKIEDVSDIFYLSRKDWDIFGSRMAQKYWLSLYTALVKCTVESFLQGLGIDRIGKSASRILGKHYKKLNEFIKAVYEKSIPEKLITPKELNSLYTYFNDSKNKRTIDRILYIYNSIT